MARRAMRRLTPDVLRLESREVLSRVVWPSHGDRLLAAAVRHASLASMTAPAIAPAQAASTGTPAPTTQQLAREQFAAGVTRIQVGEGQPRFTDQKAQFLYAGSGSGNQAKAFRFVMRLYTPLDPTQPVTGLASLRNRDVATTGTNLILDLSGSTADLDAMGRPTHLTWTVDGNSGGYYAGATAVNADGTPGTGTLDLYYGPNPLHNPHGGVNAGVANAALRGLILTNNGVTLVTANEQGHF